MEHEYAQALWQMIEKGIKPPEAIAAIRRDLQGKGRLVLLPKIARAFARIAAREQRRNTMTLSIARKKDMAHALKGAKNVLLEQGIVETDVCEELDETLIGGRRLEGRGILVDRSWKKSLLSVYNAATK